MCPQRHNLNMLMPLRSPALHPTVEERYESVRERLQDAVDGEELRPRERVRLFFV